MNKLKYLLHLICLPSAHYITPSPTMIICCLDLETSCHPRGSCWRERWRLETIINQKQKNWERIKSIAILMLHPRQKAKFWFSLLFITTDSWQVQPPFEDQIFFNLWSQWFFETKTTTSFLGGSQHYSCNFSFLFWGSHNRCRGYAVCTHQCSNIHSCSEGHKQGRDWGQNCGLLPTIKINIPSNSDLSHKVQNNHLESTFKSNGISSAD